MTEQARIVVGADGRHSLVAKAVQPERYNENRALRRLLHVLEWVAGECIDDYIRAETTGWAAFPTHDGLTRVVVGRPHARVRGVPQ